MIKRIGFFVAVMTLMAITPGLARANHLQGFVDCAASPVLLSTLVGGPGCAIDDKLFLNFGATLGAGGVNISQFLTINSVADGDLLREEIQFAFPLGLIPVGLDLSLPIVIAYSVNVLDPLFAITDFHLAVSGAFTGLVTETVTLANGTVINLAAGTNPITGQFSGASEAFFSGVGSLAVVKTITNVGLFGSGQTVNQAVTQQRVPDAGGTLLLLGMGMGMLTIVRFRKGSSQLT